MRNSYKIILFTLILFNMACETNISEDKEIKSLTLALENNMEIKRFEFDPSWGIGNALKSKIVLIPLKKEIIDAALTYKAYIEKLSEEKYKNLLASNYYEFIQSDKAGFVLLVENEENLDIDEKIYFHHFAENISIKLENGQVLKLKKYTRGFEENLNPGWNKGFLFVDNFRVYNEKINSYSVHFNGFTMKSGDKPYQFEDWAFSFDESEINYMALFERGLSYSEIRNDFVVTTYKTKGFSEEDIINIVKIILKVLAD